MYFSSGFELLLPLANWMKCSRYISLFFYSFRYFNVVVSTQNFSEVIEDQFDFHTYCMRKVTLCAYIKWALIYFIFCNDFRPLWIIINPTYFICYIWVAIERVSFEFLFCTRQSVFIPYYTVYQTYFGLNSMPGILYFFSFLNLQITSTGRRFEKSPILLQSCKNSNRGMQYAGYVIFIPFIRHLNYF